MTRKDFQLIADVIKENKDNMNEQGRQALAYSFARALNDTNPRFNIGLFLKACEVK